MSFAVFPNNPYSMDPEYFFLFSELCQFWGSETVSDAAGLLEIMRTVNADNPVKQIVPQEQRDAVKGLLKGILGVK